MYCQNCGKEIDGTVKFCPYCGDGTADTDVPKSVTEPVIEAEPIVEAVDSEPEMAVENTDTEVMDVIDDSSAVINEEPLVDTVEVVATKNNKKKFILGGVAVAAVAVIVALVFTFPYIFNSAKKTFSSPDSYYQYVEQKSADDASESIEMLFDRYDELDNTAYEGSLGLKIDKEFFNEFEDIELPEGINAEIFENIQIFFKGGNKEDLSGADISLSLSDKKIISALISYDAENDSYYLKFPELSDKYLLLSNLTGIGNDLQATPYDVDYSNIDTDALMKAMPGGEQMAKLYKKYVTICSECIEDVEEEKVEIKVGDIAQKATLITSTIDDDTFKSMMTAVLAELKEDKEIEKIIKDIAVVVNPDKSVDDVYDDFVEGIDDVLDDIDSDIIFDEKIEYKIWVNAKGEIIGRGLTVGEDVEFYYLAPVSGKKFGFEAKMAAENESITVVGNGELSGRKLNGEFDVKFNKANILKLTVSDFDRKSAEDGYLNGKFSISLSEEMIGLMSINDADIDIEDYTFNFDINSSKKSNSLSMSFIAREKELISFTSKSEIIDDYTPTIPDEKNVYDISNGDEEVLIEYFKTVNADSFVTSLRSTVLPKEVVDLIEYVLAVYSGEYQY